MMTKNFSFEFFPPKTDEGRDKLAITRRQLAQLKPDFFSVTYGAGGTTRDRTLEAVQEIHQAGLNVAPHLACMGTSREEVKQLLQRYQSMGIRRLVALRGDMPSGMGGASGDFKYASDLITFIRQETDDWFHLEVAAYPESHPQARTAQENLKFFKIKVEAGANSALTQYFYHESAYAQFVEDCQANGIDIPIVPGIMPINNFSQLCRFSDACGAEIPRWVRQKMLGFGDDGISIRAFGLDVVTHLCDKLLQQGAPGLHFYTMNQAGLTGVIWERLGLGAQPKAI